MSYGLVHEDCEGESVAVKVPKSAFSVFVPSPGLTSGFDCALSVIERMTLRALDSEWCDTE